MSYMSPIESYSFSFFSLQIEWYIMHHDHGAISHWNYVKTYTYIIPYHPIYHIQSFLASKPRHFALLLHFFLLRFTRRCLGRYLWCGCRRCRGQHGTGLRGHLCRSALASVDHFGGTIYIFHHEDHLQTRLLSGH